MSDRVRVLTANLWNGGADPQAFAELVETLDADVVCVQELSPEQADALARVRTYGCLEPSRTFSGQGIALRRPADLSRVEMPRRDAHIARLDPSHWPGLAAPLEVIAVHIVGPHVLPWPRSLGLRRGQLQALLGYLDQAPERPRALVGDLNATPLWPLYRRLAARLEDGPREVARRQGRRPAATWGPRPGSRRWLRIDHALIERVHAEDAQVVAIPGGDHSALVVDLAPA